MNLITGPADKWNEDNTVYFPDGGLFCPPLPSKYYWRVRLNNFLMSVLAFLGINGVIDMQTGKTEKRPLEWYYHKYP